MRRGLGVFVGFRVQGVRFQCLGLSMDLFMGKGQFRDFRVWGTVRRMTVIPKSYVVAFSE